MIECGGAVRHRRLPYSYFVFAGVLPAVEFGADGLVPIPVPELELAGLVPGVAEEFDVPIEEDGGVPVEDDGEVPEEDGADDVSDELVAEELAPEVDPAALEGGVPVSVVVPVVAEVVPGVVDVELPE